MKTVIFENEYMYSGNKATVPVLLSRGRLKLRVEMVLDSGAEITLLNRQFASPLGLIINEGKPIELMVANQAVAEAWIHPVEMDVLGRHVTVNAAFCPDWDTKNLLGMHGFFEHIVLAFDHANRRIYF